MRVKLDENMDPSLADWLSARGHDAATVRGQGLSGTDDTRGLLGVPPGATHARHLRS
jgi:hypothetical protein